MKLNVVELNSNFFEKLSSLQLTEVRLRSVDVVVPSASFWVVLPLLLSCKWGLLFPLFCWVMLLGLFLLWGGVASLPLLLRGAAILTFLEVGLCFLLSSVGWCCLASSPPLGSWCSPPASFGLVLFVRGTSTGQRRERKAARPTGSEEKNTKNKINKTYGESAQNNQK